MSKEGKAEMTNVGGRKTVGEDMDTRVMRLEARLKDCLAGEEGVKERLARFDELDFQVFNKQDWKLLDRSHSQDVRVIWPDGRETSGIKKHIEDLDKMFVALPDFTITSHPVSFGSGEWTATISNIEGTFTRPMPTGDGKTIPPNYRRVKLQMATIAHWKDGRIIEEYLFWDNSAFMQQLGLAGGGTSEEREAAGVGKR
ncbi:MAG: ester cyclase [Chloroflexi bacterium]|nr:ester cyclase [Chloroflexota bacterium]